MKLPYTKARYYHELKCQAGLSSIRVSCERLLSYRDLYQMKQKMLQHYQYSNLILKHRSLITTLVDSVKRLLKILVLFKSVQISNEIHNSYLQYRAIFDAFAQLGTICKI